MSLSRDERRAESLLSSNEPGKAETSKSVQSTVGFFQTGSVGLWGSELDRSHGCSTRIRGLQLHSRSGRSCTDSGLVTPVLCRHRPQRCSAHRCRRNLAMRSPAAQHHRKHDKWSWTISMMGKAVSASELHSPVMAAPLAAALSLRLQLRAMRAL